MNDLKTQSITFKTLITSYLVFSVIFNAGCTNSHIAKDLTQAKNIEDTAHAVENDNFEISAEELAQMAEQEKKAAALINKPAPDFILKDLSGKSYKLSDFRGKYVFIDFWGTWCVPCVEALPHIKETYESVDKNKIEFIGICEGCEDDMATFLKENDFPWIQLISNKKVINDYVVDSFPNGILIDPNGNILETAHTNEGYNRFTNLKKVIDTYIK